MIETAIGQLVAFLFGALVGAAVVIGQAYRRGLFERRAPEVKIDWDALKAGLDERNVITVRPNILVDWNVISAAIHAEGYALIARPKDHEQNAPRQH